MNWNYLTTERYGTRQAMAAYWLRNCPCVVEIGPEPAPLKPHLSAGTQYTDIDRFAAESAQIALPDNCGVAILGMDLNGMDDANWRALVSWLALAARVVIEYAVDYEAGACQAERLHTALSHCLLADISVALDGPPLGLDGWPTRPQRRMRVYGRAATGGVVVREVAFADMAAFMTHREGYENELTENEYGTHFGAFLDGRMVGCCTVQRMKHHPAIATFRHDYVLPEHRRQGIYARLFAARIAWCRQHGIAFVRTRCSEASLPTYLRWGFEIPPDWPHLQPVVAELSHVEES